jgi:hypothetical protein
MPRFVKALLPCRNLYRSIVSRRKQSQQTAQSCCQSCSWRNTEILYFLDDDSYITKETIPAGLKYFDNPETTAVGGPSITHAEASYFEKAISEVLGSAFGAGKTRARNLPVGKARLTDGEEIISCNLMIRRNDYLLLGGMNEYLCPGEEMELLRRLSAAKKMLYYEPAMCVSRTRRRTPLEFAKQYWPYGNARGALIRQRKRLSDLPFLLAALLFIDFLLFTQAALLCFLFAREGLADSFAGVSFLMICTGFFLAIYFSLIVLNALYISIKKREPAVALGTIFVFPLLHLSYGVGLLTGLCGYLYSRAAPPGSQIGVKKINLESSLPAQ